MIDKRKSFEQKWLEGCRVCLRAIYFYLVLNMLLLPLVLVDYLIENLPWYFSIVILLTAIVIYMPLAGYWVAELTGYMKGRGLKDELDLPRWRLGDYRSSQR